MDGDGKLNLVINDPNVRILGDGRGADLEMENSSVSILVQRGVDEKRKGAGVWLG